MLVEKFTKLKKCVKKRLGTTVLAIILWHFLIISLRPESSQVKRFLISSTTNLVHELPHGLPNDLRFRILGNLKILEKYQMWVQMQPNALHSSLKLKVENSCQKHVKLDITFLNSCPILHYFFSLWQIFWLGL